MDIDPSVDRRGPFAGDHQHFVLAAIAAATFGTVIPALPSGSASDLSGSSNNISTGIGLVRVSYGLVVLPGVSSCAGLTADNLDLFNWTCQLLSGKATFVSAGLNSGKGLRDILNSDGTGLKSDYVTVAGSTSMQSSPLNWWPGNPVLPLPDNSAAATTASITTLASTKTIYTLATSRTSAGYAIATAKTALVTLAGATLTYNGNSSANCNWTTSTTTSPAQICLLAVGPVNDVWVEANLDAYNSAQTATIAFTAGTATRLTLINSNIKNSSWHLQLVGPKNATIQNVQQFDCR